MSPSPSRKKEIDQAELFEMIQRHPDWDAKELCEALGYRSAETVRRYIRRYINRGDLREIIEVMPGPARPLDQPFLIGVVTDQNIYQSEAEGDYPPEADYEDQESLAAWLIQNLGGESLIVHDAMVVLGASFDILLFVSARQGVSDLAPMVTNRLRRYRGVRNTITMPVGAWNRQ